jgi:hypothetical protein
MNKTTKTKNMEISKLVTQENQLAVAQVLAIAKQDIALENAIKALNELNFIKKFEFENYGKTYGMNLDILNEANALQMKLEKIKFGRY